MFCTFHIDDYAVLQFQCKLHHGVKVGIVLVIIVKQQRCDICCVVLGCDADELHNLCQCEAVQQIGDGYIVIFNSLIHCPAIKHRYKMVNLTGVFIECKLSEGESFVGKELMMVPDRSFTTELAARNRHIKADIVVEVIVIEA